MYFKTLLFITILFYIFGLSYEYVCFKSNSNHCKDNKPIETYNTPSDILISSNYNK